MENQQADPLAQLKKLIVQQKTAALPDQAPDPSLQALHKDIVAYDRHVSEAVISVLGGESQAGNFPEREKLRREMEAWNGSGEQQPAIEMYRRYVNRLDQMLGLAIKVARSRA